MNPRLPRFGLFAIVACAIGLSACGGTPADVPAAPHADASMTTSALAPGQFCREATDPGGCLNGGYPIASDQAFASNCPNGVVGDNVTLELTQLISGQGVTWYDAIRTPLNRTTEYKSGWALEGNPILGSLSYLPMTEGYGILYLSQNVAMTMRRYGDWRAAPVTLLGGNLQYHPADATHPHGSWHAWVSSTGNDALGICGNFYVSWSPTS
jgi:hypothetical protein